MKKTSLLLTLALSVLFSCKKIKDTLNPQPQPKDPCDCIVSSIITEIMTYDGKLAGLDTLTYTYNESGLLQSKVHNNQDLIVMADDSYFFYDDRERVIETVWGVRTVDNTIGAGSIIWRFYRYPNDSTIEVLEYLYQEVKIIGGKPYPKEYDENDWATPTKVYTLDNEKRVVKVYDAESESTQSFTWENGSVENVLSPWTYGEKLLLLDFNKYFLSHEVLSKTDCNYVSSFLTQGSEAVDVAKFEYECGD